MAPLPHYDLGQLAMSPSSNSIFPPEATETIAKLKDEFEARAEVRAKAHAEADDKVYSIVRQYLAEDQNNLDAINKCRKRLLELIGAKALDEYISSLGSQNVHAMLQKVPGSSTSVYRDKQITWAWCQVKIEVETFQESGPAGDTAHPHLRVQQASFSESTNGGVGQLRECRSPPFSSCTSASASPDAVPIQTNMGHVPPQQELLRFPEPALKHVPAPELERQPAETPCLNPALLAASPSARSTKQCLPCAKARGKKMPCDKQKPCSNCTDKGIDCRYAPPPPLKPRSILVKKPTTASRKSTSNRVEKPSRPHSLLAPVKKSETAERIVEKAAQKAKVHKPRNLLTPCDGCRRRHFRCNRGSPCGRCTKRGIECVYSDALYLNQTATAGELAVPGQVATLHDAASQSKTAVPGEATGPEEVVASVDIGNIAEG